ncbi:MAG: alpha/beta fold hydrolase [Oligoflexus sp.]
MNPVSLYLQRSLMTIRGFESQPNSSPLTVCLHGWLDNSYSFKPLSEHLHQIHLLSIDLPGHGESDRIPPGQTYDFHQYLVWLYELQVATEASEIRLIGHSMGAAIASLYAGVFPEKVSSLVLIDGLGPLSIDESEGPKRMRTHIESWCHRKPARNSVFNDFEAAVNARLKAGSLHRPSAEILAQRGTRLQDDGSYIWCHDPRMKLPSRYQFSQAQVLSYFRNISCPSLLIQGSKSMLPQNQIITDRMQAISKLEHQVLEGGHHVHLDAAANTASLIQEFFAKTKNS